MTILLFRPQAKCSKSAVAFAKAGLDTVACGLIDTNLDEKAIEQIPEKIDSLPTDKPCYVIITSTVAAEQSALLKHKWPAHVTFFAVGKSTGRIMQQAGFDIIVPLEARTEGLLALPELSQISGKAIIIVKGFGGRELLFDTLISRGATVDEWEVYKRVKVSHPVSTKAWKAEQISCIIATSGEVIEAAFGHFDPSWLKTLTWIVVSQRTAEIASKLGIRKINISSDASDQALIQCAQRHKTFFGALNGRQSG